MFFKRMLLKRRLASSDAAVRIQALSTLEYETDHTILLQFAGEDCDSEVRSAAINRCCEPRELSVLLADERDPRVQALLAQRIDELYGELALRAAATEEESDAFEQIKNAETLIAVALRSRSPGLVLAAGARLASQQERWLQLVGQLNDDKLALELYQHNTPGPDSAAAAYLLTSARSAALRNAIAAEAAARQHEAQTYARELAIVEAAELCAEKADVQGFEAAAGQYRELEKHDEKLKLRFLAARYRFTRAQEELLANQQAEERNRQFALELFRQLQRLQNSNNRKLLDQTIESWQRYDLDKFCGNAEYVAAFHKLAAELIERSDKLQQLYDSAVECAAAAQQEFHRWLNAPELPSAEDRRNVLEKVEQAELSMPEIPERFLDIKKDIYNCERELRWRARSEAQARDIARWEHYTLKIDICNDLEKLAHVPDSQLGEAARTFRALRERWNSIGAVPNEKFEDLRNRYTEACSVIHSRLERFFAEREENFKQAQAVKEQLIREAEGLADSDDWSKTSARLKELQSLWKSAGSAGGTADRELFKRFHEVCDSFFVRRNEAWEEQKKAYMAAAKRKRELCLAVDDLKKLPFHKAKKEIAALREQWRNTPSAGKDDRLLYLEFNRRIEAIFSAFRVAGDEARRKAEIVCTELAEILEKARSGNLAIRDIERMKLANDDNWSALEGRPAADIEKRRDRIVDELQTVLCGMHHQETMHKLDNAEQLEAVIDPDVDENVLIDHLSRRLKVCGELEDRLRECRIISGGGDLAGELQQAIAGNFGGADYRLTIAELDEFLQRFVAIGHVPPDGRLAVFDRFRSLYNRALVELQREEANESGITE